MNDIDSMDMLGYLSVRAWEAARSQTESEPKRAFIDEVWPMEANVS